MFQYTCIFLQGHVNVAWHLFDSLLLWPLTTDRRQTRDLPQLKWQSPLPVMTSDQYFWTAHMLYRWPLLGDQTSELSLHSVQMAICRQVSVHFIQVCQMLFGDNFFFNSYS